MKYVLGIGLTSTATIDDVWSLVDPALAELHAGRADIAAVATITTRLAHPTVGAIGLDVVAFSATDLARQPVPHRSGALMARIETPSVAEAAALRASGSMALAIERRANRRVCIALATIADATEIVTSAGVTP